MSADIDCEAGPTSRTSGSAPTTQLVTRERLLAAGASVTSRTYPPPLPPPPAPKKTNHELSSRPLLSWPLIGWWCRNGEL